jgi:1A family penicillin-binding protein
MRKKPKKRKLLNLVYFLISVLIVFLTIAVFYFAFLINSLPEINQLQGGESTKIYDRTGNYVIYEIGPKKTILKPNEIPEMVKKAFIAVEDKDFYKHPGISFKGILRAIYLNIKKGELAYGGSTITQQVVRNLFLSQKKTLIRKIKEIILSLIIEKKYTKDEILAAYVNIVNFGEGRYGIESGSEFYFNKKTKDLELHEIALLAGIPNAPAIYSPFKNPKLAIERRNYVLKRMLEEGFISEKEFKEAISKPLELRKNQKEFQAIHFSLEIKKFLEENFKDLNLQIAGLKVISTLDYNIQKEAERLAKKYAEINSKNYNAKNIALMVQDPKTGEILALVGSKDYFDESIDGAVNVPLRPRQIGSAIKPFVYSVFFEKGYPDETILFDVQTNFSTNPKSPYIPRNWDRKFRGPVTVRQALAQSLNVPSIKVLYLAGYNDVIKRLQDLEISTLDPKKDYGLSLVLGSVETKMIDMMRAYSALSNEGYLPTQSFIKKIYDNKGNLIFEYKPEKKKVIDENITRILSDILSDDLARIGVFMPGSKLNIYGWRVAVKTGTTENSRDAWVFGYTPFMVVGVWAGNNDETPMSQEAAGFTAAVPLWHELFTYILSMPEYLKLKEIETFKEPILPKSSKPMLNGEWQIIEIKPFDKNTNFPTTNYSNAIFKQAITLHSILYYVNRNDPLGPPPQDPFLDPQFKNWELGVISWALSNKDNFELPLWIDLNFLSSLK